MLDNFHVKEKPITGFSGFGGGLGLFGGVVYSISQDKTSVDEGSSVTFTVTTFNVPDGTTLYWTTNTVSGIINSSDFTDNVTSGDFTITNRSGTVIRTLANDITTEGSESFQLQIRTESISGDIVATSDTVTINDTSTTPTFEYIGTYQFYTPQQYSTYEWQVPAYVFYLQVFCLGSGAYPDAYPNDLPGGDGGGGGCSIGVIPVTAGEVLNIGVGQVSNNAASSKGFGGSGGGFSGVFRGSTPLIIAGGGGGGQVNNSNYGGAGGGLSGQSSGDGYSGGTQVGSGDGGGYLSSGVGGGGGYYGGGGSSWSASGGGSGYIDAPGNIHTQTEAGNGRSIPSFASNHPDYTSAPNPSPFGYQHGYGGVGNDSNNYQYGSGLVVIHTLGSDYNPASPPIIPSNRNVLATY